MKTTLWEYINLCIESWYMRTLPMVDLDNGGEVTPPPTKEAWEESVRVDMKRIIKRIREEGL
jgi:hypothetical protein